MLINSTDVLLYVILWIYVIPKTAAYTPSGYLGCFEDYIDRVLQGTSHTSSENSVEYCKNICKGFRYAGLEFGHECFCGNTVIVENARNGCDYRCPGNELETCGGFWRISIYDIRSTSKSKTFASTTTQTTEKANGKDYTPLSSRNSLVSSGMSETTTSALTTTTKTDKANGKDKNLLSSRKSLDSSGNSGSMFFPAVIVPIVVVLTIAAVVVFILWRRRRLRSLIVAEGNTEASTTNMHYEDLRPDVSVESGYMEFSNMNLKADKNAESLYQNIDEDQRENKSIDDYYLDITPN